MASADAPAYNSELSTALDRFLAQLIDQVTVAGIRDAHDLLRHFPPRALMDALGDEPEYRARILVATTGIRERVAVKKSPESCGEDLEIALEEGETDPGTIAGFLTPDELVKFLDHNALWAYVTEPQLWTTSRADQSLLLTAKQHVGFVLDIALAEGLLTQGDIVEGISVPELVRHLPAIEIAGVIEGALNAGRAGASYTDESLLDTVPISMLVDHIPLPLIWDQIVVAKLVAAHKLEVEAVVDAGDDAGGGPSKPLFDESDAHPDARKVEEMLDDIQMESGPIPVEESADAPAPLPEAKADRKAKGTGGKRKPPSLKRKSPPPPA